MAYYEHDAGAYGYSREGYDQNNPPPGMIWDPVERRFVPESVVQQAAAADATPAPPGGDAAPSLGTLAQYRGPTRPDFNFGDAPAFEFSYPGFAAPSMEDAANEPGYAFARDEGQRAIQQSQAGKGILRTGGSLKDLAAWGNRFAEQNYGNVYSRRASEYDRGYGNAFGLARAQYEPRLQSWQADMTQRQRASELEFLRAMELYDRDLGRERDLLTYGLD